MFVNEVQYKVKSIISLKNSNKLICFIVVLFLCLNSISCRTKTKSSAISKRKLLSKVKRNHFTKKRLTTTDNTLTLDNIKEIIQAHNDLRNKVALGQTMKGPSLPKASNMLQVYWSQTIAKGAQEWANRCAMGHSAPGQFQYRGQNVGENIAYRGFTGASKGSPFTEFVNNWFNEIKDYNGNVGNFQNNGGPVIGHFTQVAWAESYLVGCGYCKKIEGEWTKEYMVCQYSNQGNFIGKPIYQPSLGENQCSCTQGFGCKNKDYPGLCCPDAFNWCQKESFLWTE